MAIHNEALLADVLAGFALPQKTLSPKWLYDDRGSAIFEEITTVPEYYPTRTEASIFKDALPALGNALGTGGAIAEYGAGAGVKTRALLDAMAPNLYVPIDIAEDFLHEAADGLKADYPAITIAPLAADFTQPVALPAGFADADLRLGFFPGSTIGNLSPDGAQHFLAGTRQAIGEGGFFLLGADLAKDATILEAAYDDKGGVTAAFNLNLLTRLNREIGADFDLGGFEHRAIFNEADGRVEMHLVSLRDQTVTIAGRAFSFAQGETIHTENSHKYTADGIEALAGRGGWSLDRLWTDEKDWYGVFLLKAD